jgi:FdhD protein
MNSGSLSLPIHQFAALQMTKSLDMVAVEEPLEIRLIYEDVDGKTLNQTITVTMRTPGNDIDLTLGFLYCEGVIEQACDVLDISLCGPVLNRAESQNIIKVKLSPKIKVDLKQLNRHTITNSSCGICGKTSIEALRTKLPKALSGTTPSEFFCHPELILQLPDLLRKNQSIFEQTGGLHASALFSVHKELIGVREDVGRHNALDKLIGNAFLEKKLPLRNAILLVSGRLSFELVQKASMAGIPLIAAVGAPSSLAIELARERGITLVGFIRDQRFNVYCGTGRFEHEAKVT